MPQIVALVTSMAMLWANLAYLSVTVPLLLRRLDKRSPVASRARNQFSLGRWGIPVNVGACLFGMLICVNIGWPRAEVYGPIWYERFAPLLLTALFVVVGIAYYRIYLRHRIRRAEHRGRGLAPLS
jgi:hypothetical protein